MKRKISLEFITIILSAMIIFIIGATLIARSSLNNVTELNLQHYLDIIEIEVNDGNDYQTIIDKYQDLDDYLRITFIDSEGQVLSDSLASNLDNHSDRPEILNPGVSYIRKSDTLNIDMMYLAMELDQGDYLRVAIPRASVLLFLNDFIGLSVVIGIVIIILSIMSVSVLIKYSLKPLEDIKDILIDVNEGKYTEIQLMKKHNEIDDLISEINKINQSISEHISSLKSEKRKTDFLLDHMNQGICVLNKDKHIILLNTHLKSLYRFNIDINMNKDYRFLFREIELQEAIEQVYQSKESMHSIIKKDEQYFSVSINYLDHNWDDLMSVIVIYSDVTAIKDIETLKRDFFVNASHELKSPLTSIIGSSELIVQGMAKDEKTVLDLVERIHHEANRMSHLVMDMLLLSELENKQESIALNEISVNHVIDDVINNLSIYSQRNNITIIKEVDIDSIYFNYEDLFQLIKNLVENAVKYGKVGGHVWISVSEVENKTQIQIKDDGIGIPLKEQNRIFERFYRVDKARSRLIGGTGLGLSIVKHIVLNHQGVFTLESEEDQGTTIKVLFPIIKK